MGFATEMATRLAALGLAATLASACVPDIPGEAAFGTATQGSDGAANSADGQDADSGAADADAAVSGDGQGSDALPVDSADADAPGCKEKSECPAATTPCREAACLAGACTEVASADGSACSDGIACTKNDACKAGKCVFSTNTCQCLDDAGCANKEDGNLCNGTLYCDTLSHTCQLNPATLVSCPGVNDTACRKNTCQPATGQCQMTAVKDNTACDDEDECTLSEVCKAGECVSPASKCLCKSNADCKSQDDSNLCNGTLYCDVPSGTCKTNPATVVSCPTGDDSACAKSTCDPATGQCAAKPVAENTPCDDGDPCTAPGACKAGQCVQGADICPCSVDADCKKLEDGNLCNGTLYCDKASQKCKVNPKTVVTCPTAQDGPCQSNVCDPATGECHIAVASSKKQCDADGDPCTAGDYCSGGTCVAGAAVCLCASDPDCAAKEDGDLCNGTLYCDVPSGNCKVNPATVQTCSTADDTACVKTTCDPKTKACVKKTASNNAACDDGDPCTSGDTCQQGKCASGSNLCACKSDTDCLDDGNACNGLPFCDTAAQPAQCKLKPGSAVTCSGDKNGCVVSACQPATGLCTASPGACDDGNPCTVDACDAVSATCKALPAIDGTPCGASKLCAGGACIPAIADMALVPAGQTWMGCAASESGCSSAEQPQHLIALGAYWIDRFEVSVAQYKACVDAGSCPSPGTTPATCNWNNPLRTKHPINCVGWAAAQSYCTWAGKRLASEAEWEMAARGPCASADTALCKASVKPFAWGSKAASCAQTVMADPVTGAGCGLGSTAAAGLQTADNSPVGVRDLGGNVSEWVLDTFDAGFYATSAVQNPVNTAAGSAKVLRGGSFQSGAAQVRVANRQGAAADTAAPGVGIRCAKDAK